MCQVVVSGVILEVVPEDLAVNKKVPPVNSVLLQAVPSNQQVREPAADPQQVGDFTNR